MVDLNVTQIVHQLSTQSLPQQHFTELKTQGNLQEEKEEEEDLY